MLKLNKTKKIFIPFITMALVFALVGNAFAVNDTWNAESGFAEERIGQFGVGATYCIQRLLNEITTNEHSYSLTLDGIYGQSTFNEVWQFQDDEDITEDGRVGDECWGKFQDHTSEDFDSGWWKYFVIDDGTIWYIIQSDDGYWYTLVNDNWHQINY